MKKILVAIILITLLFGCTPAAPAESSDTASTEQIEIRILVPDDDDFEEIIKEYRKQNPNTSVTVVETDEGDNFILSAKALLSGKNAPTVIFTDSRYLAELEQYAEDLSGEPWVNNAFPNTLNEASREGEIIAMPAQIEGIGFVYNKEVFEYAEINPENINSFDRLSETVEYLSGKLDALKKEFPNLVAVFESPDEETEKYLLNTALSQEFQNSTDLLKNTAELTFAESYNALLNLQQEYGKSGDITEGDVVIALKSHNSIEEDTSGKFDLLPVPVIDASQDSIIIRVPNFWLVNKNAEKKEITAAKKFLSWLYTSKECQPLTAGELRFLSPLDSTEKLPQNPLSKSVRKFAISGKTMPYVLDGIDEEKYTSLKIRTETNKN